jgi:hypothetical protein
MLHFVAGIVTTGRPSPTSSESTTATLPIEHRTYRRDGSKETGFVRVFAAPHEAAHGPNAKSLNVRSSAASRP